jgi:glycine/D-amino acid oxidase-like deaminating enzyme
MASPDDSGRCEVAVLGLGLIGAAALRYLCQAGLRCVGIGPAEPTDWSTHRGVFASHYDSGRITRRLDKQREWALLAGRAIDAYAGIEAASGIVFHHPVGVLHAEVDPTRLASTVAVGSDLGVQFERYDPGKPFGDDRLVLPDTATVLREPGPGGFIDPRRMLAAQLAVATTYGARLLDDYATAIENRSPGGWAVRTAAGSAIAAEQVLIATGPHADELDGLRRPVIDVLAETVVLARVPAAEQHRLDGLPSVIVDDPAHDHFYTVPPTEYPDGFVYMKLGATHRPEQVLSPSARRAWMSGDEHLVDVDWMRDLLLGLVPGLQAEQWLTKPCLIPDTPTKLPYVEIVDPGCIVAVGGNGYAAKSADAIGALAAGLVINGRWTDTDLDAQKFELISRD